MDSDCRYGFISHIFKELEKYRRYYGKIVVQKIVYFIQEAVGIDLDYSFSFYHYGPYSEKLERDIQLMELNNLISTSSDPKGRGYEIHLNEEEAKELIEGCSSFLKTNQKVIARVLRDFGKFKPSPLGLYATIHFVYKDIKEQNCKSDIKGKVVNIVKKMKPKFQLSFISESYDELVELNYIN